MKNKESSLVSLISALRDSGWCSNRNDCNQSVCNDAVTNLLRSKRKFSEELTEGERSIADPKGRLDFISSTLQELKDEKKIILTDDEFETACFLSNNDTQLAKKTYLSLVEASDRFSNFEQLSPFDLHFC